MHATVQRALDIATATRSDRFEPPLVEAMGQLLGEGEEAVDALADAMPSLDAPLAKGILSVWFGARVENGADATRSIDAVVACFRSLVPASEDPEHARGFQLVSQALVAHLARHEPTRERLGADTELLDTLEEHDNFGAWWVHDALTRRSGTLLVLDPALRRGIRVRYHHLSSCFHLFTLLQDVLPVDWKRGHDNASAAASARHEGGREGDEAWFHFGQPSSPKAELGGSVWGEASLDSIEAVDGEQTLVLWPPLLGSRGWDAGFFGTPLSAFPPFVELAEPPAPERLAAWWDRLETPAP